MIETVATGVGLERSIVVGVVATTRVGRREGVGGRGSALSKESSC